MVVLSACGAQSSPPPSPAVPFFLAAAAPDPLACDADADCVVGQTLDDSGCCGSFRDMALVAQSRAYADWQAAWRDAHCAAHECPSPPVPSESPACFHEARCENSRCTNTCP